MSAETIKSTPSSMEGEKHKQTDEIRDMLSGLFSRLANLQGGHKPGSSHHMGDDDEHGMRIITLAGTNTGAVMRKESSEHPKHKHEHHQHGVSPDDEESDGLETYVNSNYQAVNNSIMLDASYTCNDPGVHLDISDVVEPHNHSLEKHGKRAVRKGKAPVQGNPPSNFSE